MVETFQEKKWQRTKTVRDETNRALPTMTTNGCALRCLLLEEDEAKDLFNTDKTGLFYRCLPNKTLPFKGQSNSG